LDRAKSVLGTAARLAGRDITTFQFLNNRKDFQNAIKTLSPDRFATLHTRYFPAMLDIPGGMATLGSDAGEAREQPRHAVILSPFKMAKTETTWWQYNLFCEATGTQKPDKPAGWGGEGDNPVTNVSWYDAVDYANWLSDREGVEKAIQAGTDKDKFTLNLQAKGYRLPTEAEWEYAARAGAADSIRYAGSNNIDEVAWCYGNSNRTHPVAGKKANAFGLYDLSGNAYEWCWDWYGENYYTTLQGSVVHNPKGPDTGDVAVLRGGSYDTYDHFCRAAQRVRNYRSSRHNDIGLRLARAN
jgi:formylglycine-generating enzyme